MVAVTLQSADVLTTDKQKQQLFDALFDVAADVKTLNSEASLIQQQSAGTYGSATAVPQIVVDSKRNITSITNITISGVAPGGAAGGELSGTYPNPTLLNSAVIAKVLAGFVSGAGVITAADSILSSIQKLDGNVTLKLDKTLASGKIFRGGGTNIAIASTSSFADTYGASEIIYSSGANNVVGLATANNGVLITSAAGVPSIAGTLPNAVQDNITRLGTIVSIATPLGVAFGGTAIASFTIGDLIYASGATTLSKLADVAVGSILVSGGVGIAPAYSSSPYIATALSIGIVTGQTILHVATTSTSSIRGITSSQHSAGASAAVLALLKSRGTAAVPTIITTADSLGSIRAGGYDGSNYILAGELAWDSIGTIGANRIPSVAKFYTSTDASPSVLTESWRVDETQRLIVGGNAAFTTGVSASHIFQVRKSVNATVGQIIINENTGTSAYTQILTMNSAGASSQTSFGVTGVNTPSSGEFIQNEGFMRTTTTGMNVAVKNATGRLKIWTGATPTLRMSFDETGNLLIAGTVAPASMVGGIAMYNSTIPSGNITNGYSQYSADVVAGNAAAHFRSEAGNIVKLFTGAALTTPLTTISFDAPGTPDYNFTGSITNIGPYGLATEDEFKTLLSVLKNQQDRINELESRMQANGLIL